MVAAFNGVHTMHAIVLFILSLGLMVVQPACQTAEPTADVQDTHSHHHDGSGDGTILDGTGPENPGAFCFGENFLIASTVCFRATVCREPACDEERTLPNHQ